MKIVNLNPNSYFSVLKLAKQILANDGLVVFPSDTVYGLAANALSSHAVSKLFRFKNRPLNQSVSISVKDLLDAQKYVHINSQNKQLLKTLLPGPYTIVFNSTHYAVKQLEAADGTLAVRLANSNFMQDLNKAVPFPYTATSANIHHKGPHFTIKALLNTLSQRKQNLLDLVIDKGQLPYTRPSTIINLASDNIKILRQGDCGFKLIKQVVTNSADNTKKFAKQLLSKLLASNSNNRPIVFILEGDLGTGKTVFSKGLGENIGINNIISPTFVIYHEYKLTHPRVNYFYHFDLYRLQNEQDYSPLQIPELLKPKNILVFEWGQKLGSIFALLKNKKALIILVKIKELSIKKRELSVYQIT